MPRCWFYVWRKSAPLLVLSLLVGVAENGVHTKPGVEHQCWGAVTPPAFTVSVTCKELKFWCVLWNLRSSHFLPSLVCASVLFFKEFHAFPLGLYGFSIPQGYEFYSLHIGFILDIVTQSLAILFRDCDEVTATCSVALRCVFVKLESDTCSLCRRPKAGGIIVLTSTWLPEHQRPWWIY